WWCDTGPSVPGLRIDSTSNPLVKELAALRDRRARDASGTYLVEGARETGRAIAAGVPIIRLLHSPALTGSDSEAAALVALAGARGFETVELSAPAFTRLSLRQNPDGIAVHVEAVPLRASALADVRLEADPLILVLDGIEKPGNVGALVRTAGAVGVDLVIVTGAGTDLFNPN